MQVFGFYSGMHILKLNLERERWSSLILEELPEILPSLLIFLFYLRKVSISEEKKTNHHGFQNGKIFHFHMENIPSLIAADTFMLALSPMWDIMNYEQIWSTRHPGTFQ